LLYVHETQFAMAVSEEHFSQQLLKVINFNCFEILNEYFRRAVQFLKCSACIFAINGKSISGISTWLLSYTKQNFR